MYLQLTQWIPLLYSTSLNWCPPLSPLPRQQTFSTALVKKTSMKEKEKFSAAPWDMNGFNISGEDSERVLHAMSDSYFIHLLYHRSKPILKVS